MPLIKYVMLPVRGRSEEQTPKDKSVTQMRREAQVIPEPLPMRRAFHNPLHDAQEPTVATPLLKRRFFKRSLFENRRDLRRGIILMTILGHRRTFDPLN